MADIQLGKRKRQPETEPDSSVNQPSASNTPALSTGCNALNTFTTTPVTPSSSLMQGTDSRDLLSSPPSIDRPFRDRQPGWQEVEEKALVEFILLYGNGDSWPATKDWKYWDSAAKFIQERSGLQLRSGLEDRGLFVRQ